MFKFMVGAQKSRAELIPFWSPVVSVCCPAAPCVIGICTVRYVAPFRTGPPVRTGGICVINSRKRGCRWLIVRNGRKLCYRQFYGRYQMGRLINSTARLLHRRRRLIAHLFTFYLTPPPLRTHPPHPPYPSSIPLKKHCDYCLCLCLHYMQVVLLFMDFVLFTFLRNFSICKSLWIKRF